MDETAAREFVLDLGSALHRFGTPAHRLESALTALAAHLGLEEAQFFTTPTQLMAAFGPVGRQHTAMLRIEPGEVDLARLRELDALADAVIAGEVGVAEGLRRVEAIIAGRRCYPAPVVVLAYGLASVAVASFFGGGLPELATAGGIGLAIGVLSLGFIRTIGGSHVFDLLAAFIAATAAIGATHAGVGASYQVTTLAGIIALIPGLTLTVAMTELATRNLVSGTARLTSAAIVFLEIAFAVALAESLMNHLFGVAANVHGASLPVWTEPIALVVSALAMAVMFQAHPRTLIGVVLASAAGFYGARLGAWLFDPQLGAGLGAFLLASGANVYARIANRPAMLLQVPGIILLVPGSMGFRSLSAMVQRDVLTGIDTAFAMMLVAVSLVAGLLVANAVIAPRRNL